MGCARISPTSGFIDLVRVRDNLQPQIVGPPLVVAIHPVTAADWRDPTSYIGHWNTTLFPDAAWGPEDPMVYVDKHGVYHSVFHNQLANDDQRLCGGHAVSRGHDWHCNQPHLGQRVLDMPQRVCLRVWASHGMRAINV